MKKVFLFFYQTVIYSLITFPSFSQQHHETLDNRYLPRSNSTNGVFRMPSKYNETKTVISTITTTQVNVDSNQMNISGDAANEPSIAMNELNQANLVIGWRQFDNVISNFRQAGYAYTFDAGQTWTFPGSIEPGIFRSDPVLDYDDIGNIYYNSLSKDTANNYFCHVFKSSDGGISWSSPVDAKGGDKQWMAIDRTNGVGRGNIYSYWTSYYSSCYPDNFTRSTNNGVSYNNCSYVSGNPFYGTMAIDNSGNLFVAGMNGTDSILVAKSYDAKIASSFISWSTVQVNLDIDSVNTATVNPVGLIGQVNIEVDRTGPNQSNVYIAASVPRLTNSDPADVMFAVSNDSGITWSQPIRVNDDISGFNTQWLATMSVAPNGRIDMVWLDTRDSPGTDLSALYYSFSYDQGITWSVNEKMSAIFDPHVGYPNQDKMGDYFDMISDNQGASLAWANTLNGEQDVYFSRIIPPSSTGISMIENNSFVVYPNPNSGKFTISGIGDINFIEIYTVQGAKIFSKSEFNDRNEIDFSSRSPGIYFLKGYLIDGTSRVEKIIKY